MAISPVRSHRRRRISRRRRIREDCIAPLRCRRPIFNDRLGGRRWRRACVQAQRTPRATWTWAPPRSRQGAITCAIGFCLPMAIWFRASLISSSTSSDGGRGAARGPKAGLSRAYAQGGRRASRCEPKNLCFAVDVSSRAPRIVHIKSDLLPFFRARASICFIMCVAVNWFPALRFLASSELIGLAPAKSEAF